MSNLFQFQALCLMLCLGLVLAQQEGINKRLRFRRPRPQLTDIDNPEGVEAGPPIPLRRVPAGKTNNNILKIIEQPLQQQLTTKIPSKLLCLPFDQLKNVYRSA